MAIERLRTMNGAQLYVLVLLGIALIVGTTLFGDVARAQSQSKFMFQIQSDEAFPDSTLPERIRTLLVDDNGARLECLSVDLNDDGKKEKFVPNKFLEGNGACPWLLFDPQLKRVIGEFDAKIIYVLGSRQKGYAVLECYCRVGGDLSTVTYYAFNGHKYQQTRSIELHDQEVDRFFEERSGIPHPKWLRPGE